MDLPAIQNVEVIQAVKSMLIDGKGRTEIYTVLEEKYSLPKEHHWYAYNAGLEYFQRRSLEVLDIPVIISSHVELYEKIYHRFKHIGHNQGLLKALKGKERLLKLHTEENRLEMVQNNTFVVDESEEDYNINKLSSSEQSRLTQLLEKINSSEKT